MLLINMKSKNYTQLDVQATSLSLYGLRKWVIFVNVTLLQISCRIYGHLDNTDLKEVYPGPCIF